MNWFVCDRFEGEFELFETEKEAEEWCKERIDSYHGEDSWPEKEDMQGIQMGRITAQAKQIDFQTREEWEKENPDEGWPDENWCYVCNYELKELK